MVADEEGKTCCTLDVVGSGGVELALRDAAGQLRGFLARNPDDYLSLVLLDTKGELKGILALSSADGAKLYFYADGGLRGIVQ